jgi:thiamine pyrophosphate-dependent acetolactate synthase large subunit-like protein
MIHATETPPPAMPVVAALQVLIDSRHDTQIVVTNQASARIWPRLSRHRLDFHYNPSTMGGAIPLGLGLAMAQPRRHVLVVSGDGALLMSLGSLVTVVGTGVSNLTIVVLNNRLYEVTGGQKTPAAGTSADLGGLARAAGFPTVESFHDLTDWQSRAMKTLSLPGPRFVELQVDRTPSEYLRFATPAIDEQLATLQQMLKGESATEAAP